MAEIVPVNALQMFIPFEIEFLRSMMHDLCTSSFERLLFLVFYNFLLF